MKKVIMIAAFWLPMVLTSCRTSSGEGELKQDPSTGNEINCSELAKDVNNRIKLSCPKLFDEVAHLRGNLVNVESRSPNVTDVIKLIDSISFDGLDTREAKDKVLASLQTISPKIEDLYIKIRTPLTLPDPNIAGARGSLQRIVAFLEEDDGFFISAELTKSTDSITRGDMARTANKICQSRGQEVRALIQSGCRKVYENDWSCRGVYNCRTRVF